MRIDHQLFLTGIPLIDQQHEEYLKLVDTVFHLCESAHADQAEVDASLEKAFAYAVEHFDAEEALMRSIDYPYYEGHRLKHDEFRDQVDKAAAMSGGGSDAEEQLIHLTRWLLEWFQEQVLTHDRRLARHIGKQEQHEQS